MNKIFVILTALFLSACASQPSQLDVPEQIQYKNKHYHKVAGQDLGSVARYVYLSKLDTLEKWQSQIELLLDRNERQLDIKDRITLRERVYRNTEVASFKLTPIKNSKTNRDEGLKGYVIYRPTEKDPYWQVNMMRGEEIAKCGFVQFQYAQKVKKSRYLSEEKILRHLQKYLVAKEMKNLEKMDWQWHCQNPK
ncbi:hypothetical protein [Rodentibacter trehalosifermentans]|uniref:6-phosphofructokinase n=1 Tax=Rodentibacter trehalosifermentans TaxID=1908263 RepID=A0A1V3IUV2_9PAST|nr:hypothetical protein [Rodentibacter trehalosifermentans]OOF45864.1 hypothetical protein BKK51_04785 [Rodentibacter trehalosifermentans]OOF52919.1 hypothetical protein BKK53_03050 [Rodentibacter trehalosifermentans]